MKPIWMRLILSLGFAVAGIALTLRGVDGVALGLALHEARLSWLVLAALCFIIALTVRALRFRLLLNNALSLGEAIGVLWIGYTLSNLLPLRAGDPARAWLVGKRAAVPFWKVLPAVMLERTLDLLAVTLLMSLTVPLLPVFSGATWGPWSLVLAGAIFLALLALPRVHLPLPNPALEVLTSVQAGLRSVQSPRRMASVAILTCLAWLTTIAYFYAGLRAFVADAPWLTGPILTWASALGVATPAPGGVGPYHFAIRLVLTQGFAMPEATAVSYALVIHALQYLGNTLPGVLLMGAWGLSWRALNRVATQPGGL